MDLMSLFCFLSLGDLHGTLAAPAFHNVAAISAMSMSRGFGPSHMTNLWVDPYNQYAFSNAISSAAYPSTLKEQAITTVTITREEPITITVFTPTATTVTEFITIPISPYAASPSLVVPTPSLGEPEPAKAIWVAPPKMDDLTPFSVTEFPSGGRKNLQIVTKNPKETPTNGEFNGASTKSGDSILQVFFPEGSIDPAHKPHGGAEFYATPLDISSARNVTLKYSVFFPANFNWVLAGKLPGLYGGHTGCSGGNPALDCFSTRLMWRKEGAGELYLYAPKKKQTEALCSDPGSICDTVYGLSIGRGSFTWAAGDWTTIQQTVVLNSPGMQDGCFTLDVNGQRVIDRVDVLYRDAVPDKDGDDDDDDDDAPPKSSPKKATTTSTKRARPTSTSGSTKVDGGLLGPILGGLLQGLGLRDLGHYGPATDVPVTADLLPTTSESGFQPTSIISFQHISKYPQPAPTATAALDPVLIRTPSNAVVGFVGIFFSTFFGGHEDEYATPRDQYIWFKDFALAYNS